MTTPGDLYGRRLLKRLAALGVDRDFRPELDHCPMCQDSCGTLHIEFDVFRESWAIWCECGDTVEAVSADALVSAWNERARQITDRRKARGA